MTEFDSNKNENETNGPSEEGDKSYSQFRPPWDVSKPREVPREKTETIIAENLSTGPEIADAIEREIKMELPIPLGPIFGDMAGVVFLCWIPVLLAYFLPWSAWLPEVKIIGDMTVTQLIVAIIIALPPWIILTMHLVKGHIWDGIMDMILWAIWECGLVILLIYLYPVIAPKVFWNASNYWNEMSGWIASGNGTEGNPSLWIPLHLKHLILLIVFAFFFGLPALLLGVFLLNYMNYYVAMCMLASDNPLVVMMVAWHLWSILRVFGYITLASSVYQTVLNKITGKPYRWGPIVGAYILGFALVIADGFLKWQLSETVRNILNLLCKIR